MKNLCQIFIPAPKIKINIDKNFVWCARKLWWRRGRGVWSKPKIVAFDDFHAADSHAMACFKLPVI